MPECDQESAELWAGVVDEALVHSEVFNGEALNSVIFDAKPQYVKAVRKACLEALDAVIKNIVAKRDAAQSACDAELKRQFEEMEELRKELGLSGKKAARGKEDKDNKEEADATARRSNGHGARSALSATNAEASSAEVTG